MSAEGMPSDEDLAQALLAMNALWGESLDLAEDEDTEQAVLWVLAQHGDEVVREAVAGNPSVPPELLSLLARDWSPVVRQAVRENDNADEETAALLAALELAEDPETLPDILASLVAVPDELVHVALAANASTPVHLLEQFAQQLDSELESGLCWALASNPNTPRGTLATLARSAAFNPENGESVALLVAMNPNTPPVAIAELADSELPSVRQAILSRG
jgi:hypothetical protein